MTYDNFASFAKETRNYGHRNQNQHRNNNSKRKKFDLRRVTISSIEDLFRENRFLKDKLNTKDVYIRQLEYDNADLQRNKKEQREFRNKQQNGYAGRNHQGKFKRNY